MEIFHMLAENSIKLNITHIYLVTGENPVNGWTWPAEMESALCTRIESINKNTTQFPSATFLIHLSYTFRIHHAFHCNSAAKAHTKEILWVPQSADWMRQVTKPGRKSKYIWSSLLWAANMIPAEKIWPPLWVLHDKIFNRELGKPAPYHISVHLKFNISKKPTATLKKKWLYVN